jgi:hypothetical protein
VGDVEQDVIGAALFHFAVDRASDDVTRREGFQRVPGVHEFNASDAFQNATFAADGFADEKGFCSRMVEAGGMKLDELHVCDGSARAIGHGNTVAGGDIRVGGIEIDFSATARRQEGDRRRERFNFAGSIIEYINAEATVVAHVAEFLAGDEIDGEMIFVNFDVGPFGNRGEEGTLDFAAGDVFGVENSTA